MVKAALRRVFGKSKMQAWTELKKMKLIPGDSVDVVTEEIKSLLKCATDQSVIPETLVALQLIDALPSAVAEKVTLQYGEELQLEKIVSASKSLMAAMDSAVCAAAAQEDRRRGPSTATGRSSQIRCYGCQRFGHEKKDCRVVCYRCRARGHVQRLCPSGNGSEGVESAGSSTSLVQH